MAKMSAKATSVFCPPERPLLLLPKDTCSSDWVWGVR